MDSKDTELEDRDGKIIERDIEDEMKTANQFIEEFYILCMKMV